MSRMGGGGVGILEQPKLKHTNVRLSTNPKPTTYRILTSYVYMPSVPGNYIIR